ncbi:MAG: hypothetical protein ACYC5K_03590 [Saccharofermentanales bacterium]
MYKTLSVIIVLVFILLIPANYVFAASSVEIDHLLEDAEGSDGKQFIIKGEVIGEAMNRGAYCWINIKDSTNAIGVWMNRSDAGPITNFGSYRFVGDTVEIAGTFRRACIEHGGEADFHCERLSVIRKGYPVEHKISRTKGIYACGLSVLLLFSALIVYFSVIRKNLLHNNE